MRNNLHKHLVAESCSLSYTSTLRHCTTRTQTQSRVHTHTRKEHIAALSADLVWAKYRHKRMIGLPRYPDTSKATQLDNIAILNPMATTTVHSCQPSPALSVPDSTWQGSPRAFSGTANLSPHAHIEWSAGLITAKWQGGGRRTFFVLSDNRTEHV